MSGFNAPVPPPVNTPEPSSVFGLFAICALGAGSIIKRKLK